MFDRHKRVPPPAPVVVGDGRDARTTTSYALKKLATLYDRFAASIVGQSSTWETGEPCGAERRDPSFYGILAIQKKASLHTAYKHHPITSFSSRRSLSRWTRISLPVVIVVVITIKLEIESPQTLTLSRHHRLPRIRVRIPLRRARLFMLSERHVGHARRHLFIRSPHRSRGRDDGVQKGTRLGPSRSDAFPLILRLS